MEKQISLHYQDDRSDKIYNAFLKQEGAGYVVNFSFGRRGSALAVGSKTQAPVDLAKAQKVFDKLVSEKTGKGYRVIGEEAGAVNAISNAEASGVNCQLLNPIEECEVERYLADDRYLAEEKWDGRRQLIEKKGSEIKCINRKGLYVGFSTDFDSVKNSPHDFIIDGELMDGYLVVFDILELNGKDLRSLPLEARLKHRHTVVEQSNAGGLIEVITALKTIEKRRLFERLKTENKEGIVFKRKSSVYTAGRPASGGDQLKYKFYKTASFIVSRVNDKRSVGLELMWLGKKLEAGNVTIPANHEIPAAGEVVEVRYLYAFKNSGIIFQPVYLGKRSDINPEECLNSQLVFKAEEEE